MSPLHESPSTISITLPLPTRSTVIACVVTAMVTLTVGPYILDHVGAAIGFESSNDLSLSQAKSDEEVQAEISDALSDDDTVPQVAEPPSPASDVIDLDTMRASALESDRSQPSIEQEIIPQEIQSENRAQKSSSPPAIAEVDDVEIQQLVQTPEHAADSDGTITKPSQNIVGAGGSTTINQYVRNIVSNSLTNATQIITTNNNFNSQQICDHSDGCSPSVHAVLDAATNANQNIAGTAMNNITSNELSAPESGDSDASSSASSGSSESDTGNSEGDDSELNN